VALATRVVHFVGAVTQLVPRPSDGTKSGMTAEGARAALKQKQMSLQEAQMILGIEKNATLDEIRKVQSQIQPSSTL
jgi:hypothetical protein